VTQGLPSRYSPGKDARDVLLITIDTCRADYLGSYGHPLVKTPMLDKIARNGLVVEDAITSIPVTTPGHATIMTGMDPPEHGSRFNAVPIRNDIRTLAEVFRDNGYSTGAFVSAFVNSIQNASIALPDNSFSMVDPLGTVPGCRT